MALGDKIFISPALTHLSDWVEGKVIDVENNSFVGTVISAQTADGNIYFDKAYNFKTAI